MPLSDLRFGDFDAGATTDVYSRTSGVMAVPAAPSRM